MVLGKTKIPKNHDYSTDTVNEGAAETLVCWALPFPASTWRLTTICVPGDAMPYSHLCRHCMHTAHIHTCRYSYLHINLSQSSQDRGHPLIYKLAAPLACGNSICIALACSGTCSVDQAGLELTEICLPLPPECWD